MKRHIKKAFGFFGLLLVVATTVFAATLPVPEATATTTVTDTITVRVIGSVPNVSILGISNDEIITVPRQSFIVNYENVETLAVILEHKDVDGNIATYTLDELTPNYIPGTEEYNIHL